MNFAPFEFPGERTTWLRKKAAVHAPNPVISRIENPRIICGQRPE
jgi:hypothetical protein